MFSTSKYPTISLVYSSLNALNEDLNAFVADGQELSGMLHRVINKLSKYTENHKNKQLYMAAALLDPRIKITPFPEFDTVQLASFLKYAIEKYFGGDVDFIERERKEATHRAKNAHFR